MSRKTLYIVTIVLFVVSIIVGVFTFANTTAITSGESKFVDPLFWWTALLLLVTVVLALVMPLPSILQNPKMMKRTLFVIVGIIVAFGIVYVLSKGKPDEKTEEVMWAMNPIQKEGYVGSSVIASMNIIAVEIALLLAFVAVVWSALKGLIKK
jgi:FtsH-binding integral membrane protein